MKISELVKTYKLLNDPKAPDWNVKFLSTLGIAAVILAGIGSFWYVYATTEGNNPLEPGEPLAQDASEPSAAGTLTEFVGPDRCDAAAVVSDLATWEAAHAGAQIHSRTPVERGGCVVGYDVVYTP